MEKNRVLNQSINHSLTHSPSLFDALGTEACASEKLRLLTVMAIDRELYKLTSGNRNDDWLVSEEICIWVTDAKTTTEIKIWSQENRMLLCSHFRWISPYFCVISHTNNIKDESDRPSKQNYPQFLAVGISVKTFFKPFYSFTVTGNDT